MEAHRDITDIRIELLVKTDKKVTMVNGTIYDFAEINYTEANLWMQDTKI